MTGHKKYLHKGRLQVVMYLDNEHLAYLQGQATAKGMSVSAYMRWVLDRQIKANGGTPTPAKTDNREYYAPIVTA